jgi:hypothetical protein
MSDDYGDEDRPYTEAQWEALFRKSDLKAAKYEEHWRHWTCDGI